MGESRRNARRNPKTRHKGIRKGIHEGGGYKFLKQSGIDHARGCGKNFEIDFNKFREGSCGFALPRAASLLPVPLEGSRLRPTITTFPPIPRFHMPKVSMTPFTVSRTVAPLLSEHAGPAIYHRERLSMAHQILDGIPETAIILDDWVTKLEGEKDAPACGTIACGAGWLAMHPYFHKHGLYLHNDSWAYCPRLNNEAVRVGTYGTAALAEIFVHEGEGGRYMAAGNLFGTRDEGDWDGHLVAHLGNPSDKELLLARIKYAYHHFSK